jgi:hypothetical protein
LRDRIIETLRYLSDEIESRRAGGLGEAQAAGYVAGRLRRADYSAAVQSFHAGISDKLPLVLAAWLAAVCGGAALLAPAFEWPSAVLGVLSLILVLAIGLLLVEAGTFSNWRGVLRRLRKGKISQSVVAGRAAKGKQTRWRVLIIAPLDGPPRPLLERGGFISLVVTLLVNLGAVVGLSITSAWGLQLLLAAGSLTALGIGILLLVRRAIPSPLPAIYGAGELATLLMIAEELEPLQSVEVWVIALGGSTVGTENIHALIGQYPFSPVDTCVINLHNISVGQPVFVTREGVLRERRSDRMLLAAAADTDAADITIDAEPRRIRERTLAQAMLQQRFRAITISSHSSTSPFTSPEPSTIEYCVHLVVGMVRRLDT